MLNWLLFCSFIISLLMTLLGLVMDLTYHFKYQPRLTAWQAQVQESLPTYLATKNRLTQAAFFKGFETRSHNIAPFMDHFLNGAPLMDQETLKNLLALDGRWLEKRHKIPKQPHLYQLFESVKNFDHWQLTEEQAAFDNNLPLHLIVATRIYLADQNFHSGPAMSVALDNVRSLGRLLLTVESLNFERAGLSILEKEVETVQFIQQKKLIPGFQREIPSLLEIKDYLKHLEETQALFHFLTPEPVLQEVFLKGSLPLGFCAIYRSQVEQIHWLEEFFVSPFPFEPRFTKGLRLFDQIESRAKQECLAQPKKISHSHPWTAHVPYFRRIVGINLMLPEQGKGPML